MKIKNVICGIFLLIFISACSKKVEPELIDIEFSNINITPAFSKDIVDYTLDFEANITKTTISAVSSGYGTNIFYSFNEGDFNYVINGDISLDIELPSKDIKCIIIVSNKNKVKTYRFSSESKLKKTIELTALKITPGLLKPEFSSSVTQYTFGIPNRGKYIYIQPSSNDAIVSYSINNSTFTNLTQDTYSKPISVKVGSNPLQIKVEKEGYQSTNYNFNIKRYENADLKTIAITPGIFEEQLSPENSIYTANIKSTETTAMFELFAADDNATISMYNKKTPQKLTLPVKNKYEFKLTDQPEEFIAIVRAIDGYRRYYTFKINRL